MMYEELVERLRNYECERDDDGKCYGCPDEESYYPCCVDCFSRTHRQAADAIEELQKALDAVNDAHNEGYDVVLVRHGRWKDCKPFNPEFNGYECSECGARYQGFSPDNYCPNCGAKMDGEA